MRWDNSGQSRCHGQRRWRRCLSRSGSCGRQFPVQWGHRLHTAINGYAVGIVHLIGEFYGQHTIQTAWHEFNIGKGKQPFYGYDANAELFYSWLFHKWSPDREEGHEVRDETVYGVPPTRAYLDRCASTLNPLLRTYLETCLTTSPRFYEVLDCTVGFGFRASDVLTECACTVSDALASTSLEKGDILYAHLIPMGQITLMEAVSPRSFPPQCKRRLLGLRQRRPRENEVRELREVYFTLSDMASR
jgi:hypothetical protein